MRGKAYDLEKVPTNFRITPAYAGKRYTMQVWVSTVQDHPRLCGEKGTRYTGRIIYARITPAYAGKSCFCGAYSRTHWDHPRLCGEKYIITSTRYIIPGSPPPMRGKAGDPAAPHCSSRITPAYAGKSHFILITQSINKDHPRLCGEKVLLTKPLRDIQGSPPPMRGKVDCCY